MKNFDVKEYAVKGLREETIEILSDKMHDFFSLKLDDYFELNEYLDDFRKVLCEMYCAVEKQRMKARCLQEVSEDEEE